MINKTRAADAQQEGDGQKRKKPIKLLPGGNKKEAVREAVKKKDFFIPTLRTYEGDWRQFSQKTGTVELRTILAREAAEKKRAQAEYRQGVRALMKEALVLKEDRQAFSKKWSGGAQKPKSEQAIHRENMAKSIADAVAYIQETPQKVQSGDGETPVLQPNNQSPDNKKASDTQPAAGEKTPSRENAAPSVAEQVSAIPEHAGDPHIYITENKGHRSFFGRLRNFFSRKPGSFLEEEQKKIQQEQEQIVEKETMRKRWQEFEKKKELLREKGFLAHDTRSYDFHPPRSVIVQKQNVVAIILVLLTLFFLVVVIISIATRSDMVVITAVPGEADRTAADVISSERQFPVDITTSSEEWNRITQGGGTRHTVTKFVPYAIQADGNVLLSLEQFSEFFSVNMPVNLLETLSGWYFVGNYTTTHPNGIFIVGVRRHGDALVWMRNWEKDIINAFSGVFPNTLRRGSRETVTVEQKVIDNKTVRILKNQESEYQLMYYFFNRSILVVIVGNESVVEDINRRIRSANTQ